MSDADEPARKIVVPREQRAGVWANDARLNFSKHEFTIDFVRLDPLEPLATVVARVSCSAAFLEDLIRRLTAVWQDWARTAMPPEVTDDGEGTA